MARSHDMIKVSPNGSFTLTDALLVDYRQQTLAVLLHEMQQLEARLETLTRRALAEDERIIGQEKANIVYVLHALVRNFVAMRLRMVEAEKAGEYTSGLKVLEDKEGYVVTGQMQGSAQGYSLSKWLKDTLEPETERLVDNFQKAAKNREISPAERVKLVAEMDMMLLQTIHALHVMRTGHIFQ